MFNHAHCKLQAIECELVIVGPVPTVHIHIYYLYKCLNIFQNVTVAVQQQSVPSSIRLTHEYDVSLKLREDDSPWVTVA